MPNYCGIRPALLGGWADKACKWHDEAYTKGSTQQRHVSREEVDLAFLNQLLDMADGRKYATLRRLQAYTFYSIVRVFGGLWWEGKMTS